MNLYAIGEKGVWFEFIKAKNRYYALKDGESTFCAEGLFCHLVEKNTQETESNPDWQTTCKRLGFELIESSDGLVANHKVLR